MKGLPKSSVLVLLLTAVAFSTVWVSSSANSRISYRHGQSSANNLPDLNTVPPDLSTPPVTDDQPAPRRRVKQTLPEYQNTEVYHALYLPIDWKKGRRYPVIVEYPGNGPYRSPYGDISTGQVDGCDLGYGVSGGKEFIWVSMPFVNSTERKNQLNWWGDVRATIDYCKQVLRMICQDYGGDSAAIFLAGFSRGAIACNYIGLHDDEIADTWLAFIPYSHYDGVRKWNYPESDKKSALERLKRLRGRASFITQEGSVEDIRQYLSTTGITAPFTLQSVNFRNHNDAWVLRDTPVRQALRRWVEDVLKNRPGVYSVSGRVTDINGRPLSGVYIRSGYIHSTLTDKNGRYKLEGLTAFEHKVTAIKEGYLFTPSERIVTLGRKNASGRNFSARRSLG